LADNVGRLDAESESEDPEKPVVVSEDHEGTAPGLGRFGAGSERRIGRGEQLVLVEIGEVVGESTLGDLVDGQASDGGRVAEEFVVLLIEDVAALDGCGARRYRGIAVSRDGRGRDGPARSGRWSSGSTRCATLGASS